MMPKFHFNIINGYTLLDPCGRKLPDEQAARAEAEHVASVWEEGKHVQVTDEHGHELQKIPTKKKEKAGGQNARREPFWLHDPKS